MAFKNILLYSWIIQVRNAYGMQWSWLMLFLLHDVWHLSLDVSMAGCVSTTGSWNHLEASSHTYLTIDTGCHLWSHMGVSTRVSTYGLSLWPRLSHSGLRVVGLLIPCPRVKVKTITFCDLALEDTYIVFILPHWLRLSQAHLDPWEGN